MTALQAPRGSLELVPTEAPVRTPEYDWPDSPLFELWALRIRIDALCRKGEAAAIGSAVVERYNAGGGASTLLLPAVTINCAIT